MNTQTIAIACEADTEALGQRLAATLPVGRVVSLVGPLGAGKTRLVQAIVRALGAHDEVTSPTFVLVNEYTTGRVPVYHFDAYRLKDDDEFLELGADEYFTVGGAAGPGLCLVEWGDRVTHLLPPQRITMRIELGAGEARTITIAGLELA
ncbi:tRNA (adenosine(37)-N6)-threonylcarbamoyltransferase complex ATPase subunit type 1 TsaE [Botrimarina hoheduenensis]|uniref:tRNA threonylcarbamoyladenosine biosynthesis protein TsaE n=1 Tax=Botrimarina hoheduenensis TaxID=2528000 RepID=A0A5C5WEF1_9BACT|nr:tRNA (adenosine(37)-N6)-threonylcarbamoyltransferase complex ATPase subunit type 1 TsaE [Botrimarina hoheduenensis]TWT48449.1 tRNA threonylcarbamoyladenosine biosynthesis protein TsaE [Botrimarina hoheduenensis]